MNILLIDNGTRYINHLLTLLSYEQVDLKPWSQLSSASREYDAIILSGGHSYEIATHSKEYAREIAYIKESPSPILGICLGFELIAYTFGAKLKKISTQEKGTLEIEITTPDPLFIGLKQRVRVFENHRWVVDELPEDLSSLARSKDGIEILRHNNRMMYGVQFHPELCLDQNKKENFITRFLEQARLFK
ncbi:GMP synthase [Candidatus Uhrbacteria bacterium]|nr:GMP synthase [Candidatus Uhrbacteria bacterium]